MSVSPEVTPAHVQARTDGEKLVVTLLGRWRVEQPRPQFSEVVGGQTPEVLRIEMDAVETWDSSLLLFLNDAQRWALAQGARFDLSSLPLPVRQLLSKLEATPGSETPPQRAENFLTVIGLATTDIVRKGRGIATFVGECVLSALRLIRQPRKFRWHDCLAEMQQCGAMALPIVGLISLLVGLIMAYQAAVQLRQFGADIYVADLVGLAVVREMGPMMAAVIMAGRTGAAFAATIGNMKAGEEIDALETLGIVPIDFLVMPRLVALGIMMPLLAMYANLLGVLGGMVVGAAVLDIPPAAYWVETQSIVDLSDVSTGLIKAAAFGLLIGLSGCHRGLNADRSAAGVGRAATSAVVTAILLVIVSDALFAVAFNILGL
ncbi:MAG TPA: ABC transporter permease [Opitutaceae bacterium]|nr:ABC transporter permease [Opitutaceae bacterium]